MKKTILIALLCGTLLASQVYYSNRISGLHEQIGNLENSMTVKEDKCETRVAMLKAQKPENSCGELKGHELADFIGQLPPETVNRFIEHYRKRSAMAKGYELPRSCIEMLPPECFKKPARKSGGMGSVHEKRVGSGNSFGPTQKETPQEHSSAAAEQVEQK
jgi:hypothetical protein